MQRVLVAPGAFKNSLGANQAADAIVAGLKRAGFNGLVTCCPIADGGNGTLDAFCATGAYKRQAVQVNDPLGQEISAEFAVEGTTAIIEMALASGIELCDQNNLQVMRASTYGTGQLMRAALDAGATQIIVGLGGSATVDGGMGCLQALGAVFYDQHNQAIADNAAGGDLHAVARVDLSALDARIAKTEIIIACDVDNPVIGADGSAEMFGPQKGADADQVILLAAGLDHFFGILHTAGLNDVRKTPGAGAAGSIAGALLAACGGRIEGGFELWQQHSHFEDLVTEADFLITGEGRMDDQTIHGKGPMGAAQIAKKHGLRTAALVGGLSCSDELLHEHGLDLVLPIAPFPIALDDAIARAEEFLSQSAVRLSYALQLS